MSSSEERMLQVAHGVIKSRRCLGKHLSFATLACAQSGGDVDEVNVMFRRCSFDPDNEGSSSFPTKLSDLPYGAQVEAQLVHETDDESPLQVRSWRIVGEHPRTHALHLAQESNGGGVSCTKYLQARSEAFLNLHSAKDLPKNFQADKRGPRRKPENTNVLSTGDESAHGTATTRGRQARIFSAWLVKALPMLRTNDTTVLDVAGGKGQLSVELAKFGIACTVIDPLIRGRRHRKKLDKSRRNLSTDIPSFVAARFEQDRETDQLVTGYSCLVGFHPDEATEAIVDMALRHNKLLAVVPCCVFPSFFPLRRLNDGATVQTYDQFLDYLLEKDARLKRASLPVDGPNQVIYLSGEE